MKNIALILSIAFLIAYPVASLAQRQVVVVQPDTPIIPPPSTGGSGSGLNPNDVWLTHGNSGTSAGVNFLGTIDAQDLVIKIANNPSARFGQLFNNAFGYNTVASGQYSFASGYLTNATNQFAHAFGLMTQATGVASTALGNQSIASGNFTTAIGSGAVASGGNAFAIGNSATASGDYSFALGNFGTTASGSNAFAFGSNTTASGSNAFAFGESAIASGNDSTALGYSTKARSYSEISLGAFSTDYTPASTTSMDGDDRLLVVGNGLSAASDAFTILKNAKVGINIDNFEATIAPEILQVNDSATSGAIARFANASGFCQIAHTGITCSSDENLKTDITNIESGISVIKQLQPVTYYWNNDTKRVFKTYGFLAQDVAEVVPDLVHLDDATKTYTLDYGGMIPLLVKAVQEVTVDITDLVQKIVADSLAQLTHITAQTITATDTLCIDDVCITKDDLKDILAQRQENEKSNDEQLSEVLIANPAIGGE